MNRQDQAAGEARVRQVLIDPLLQRGLMKPSTMTKPAFEKMLNGLCAKLAYMAEDKLAALEEEAAQLAGGKERDRFPIANRILERSLKIQPPADDASPLIRAVFTHDVGQTALAEGWGPELLAEVRKTRRWPTAWVIKTVKDRAGEAARRLQRIEEHLARGGEITRDEQAWRANRLADVDKCRWIADLATKDTAS
ncbi:hypothetical protein [Pseudaestuariivita rosea]|uniref:hypothetical protein n=1 Tax=Pseudaestuariivita rosea TaxID=2763263 RepID=UPI001ABAAAED|nr:hypothetical protein [Pseudaestuariivita rosea]